MKHEPLISFITPTYNHEKYIGKCIESVLNQRYPYVEQIIVDDGSTDGTGEIASSVDDPRVKYFRQENKGVGRLDETYNFALSKAKGDIIAILEGDDYNYRNRATMHALAMKDPSVIISWGVTERWKERLYLGTVPVYPSQFEHISDNEFIRLMFLSCIPAANTAAIRKDALLKIGGFQHGEYYTDYPTWLALLPYGKIKFSNEIVSVWGVHDDSYTMRLGGKAKPHLDALKYYEKMPDWIKNLVTPSEIRQSWKKSYLYRDAIAIFQRTLQRTAGIRKMWTAMAIALYKSRSTFAIPTSLEICVTPACNIRCKYCMREQFTPPGKPMTLETLQYILSRMPYIGDICIQGLCEPFLNPELPAMVRWLKTNGYRIALTTNGTIPIKDMEMLRYVDDMVFSIDTNNQETFTYLRGGAKLDKVMENLENVIKYKKEHNLGQCDNPPIHINSVITRKNIDQMTGLFEMLEPYADDLTYVMVDPISRPDYQTFEAPLALSYEEFGKSLDEIKEATLNFRLNILGFDWMLKPSYDWDRCPLSWWAMWIEPNGDAYFCYDYRRVLGNVISEEPLRVWNSDVARDFRRRLLSPNPPIEQCKTCNFARKGWQPDGEYLEKQGKVKYDIEK